MLVDVFLVFLCLCCVLCVFVFVEFLFCLPYDVVYYVWVVTIFLCYVFDCVHFFIVVLLAHGYVE